MIALAGIVLSAGSACLAGRIHSRRWLIVFALEAMSRAP